MKLVKPEFNPLLAIPTYGGKVTNGLALVLRQPFRDPTKKANIAMLNSGFVNHSFNTLWCIALNNRKTFTHFAMIHSDVVPENGFLDILHEEMNAIGADVIAANSPLKANDGVTSTGVDYGDIMQRYTVKEINSMKEDTFTNWRLAINTAIMLVSLEKKWMEEIHFEFIDRIKRKPDGSFYAVSMPEDWLFSRKVREKGGVIAATRKVSLMHFGEHGFSNQGYWGSVKEDEGVELP